LEEGSKLLNADEYASQSGIAVSAGWNPVQLPWAVISRLADHAKLVLLKT